MKTKVNIQEFNNGVSIFSFDKLIYASAEVKFTLRRAQHDKCCYCEKSIFDYYCDVEHFRPKSAVKVVGQRSLRRPGYFWLAYDWDNLLLACEPCNRSHKKNQFPVVDELSRGSGHTLSTAAESFLLINPLIELPEKYLTFRCEYVVAIENNIRGTTTRQVVALDREELNELRREHLKTVEVVAALARLRPALPESLEAKELLYGMVSDRGKFAACTRKFLQGKFGTSDIAELCGA